MPVDAVSSTSASAVTSAASNYVKQVTGNSAGASGASSALQEATETPAVTAKEAAQGDPVAKRLLAKQQQEKELENPTPSNEPGKGEQVDQKA